MVAVSGASLAHLNRLTKLNVAHNFLRALTSDLVLPLRNLTELRLDDNDISMVASDALLPSLHLSRFTLSGIVCMCACAVSYTHLDVYKRQGCKVPEIGAWIYD